MVNAQNFNRPVPSFMLPYEYHQIDTNINFYLGINTRFLGNSFTGEYKYQRGVLLDPDGYIAWYQTSPAHPINGMNSFGYDEEHDIFTEVIQYSATEKDYVRIDTNFQIIDTITTLNVDPDSHEFLLAANGNRILSTTYDEYQDLSGSTINGGPGVDSTVVQCNGFQEFDDNGNLLFEWSSCDEIHPSEAYGFAYNVNKYDYFHINAIDLDDDDNFIVSGRHINSVVKVNHNTGAVMWRLGGSNSDFTFIGDDGFSGQHDCRSEGNGIVTIYDNGNLSAGQKSRAVRYQLDTVNWTATVISEFDHNPIAFGRAMGSYRTIDGYGVVNYGFILRPDPNITIFDASNTVAAEYFFTDSAVTYRAIPSHLGFNLDRPVIECHDSLGMMYLKAPDGFASYEWSNGATTQEIVPVVGEVYQVYVPHGIGNYGSIPFGYDGTCISNVSVPELDYNAKKTLLKITNVLGQEVDEMLPGNVYIEIYSDGSSRRVMNLKE